MERYWAKVRYGIGPCHIPNRRRLKRDRRRGVAGGDARYHDFVTSNESLLGAWRASYPALFRGIARKHARLR
jgi:hypothetical protein